MIVAKISVVGLIFQVSASNALSLRDVNGNWGSLSWEKRSNPGDILKIPLTSNNDKSYSAPVRMGTPFQIIEMAISLSQNHIAVESPDIPGQPGYYDQSASQSFKQGNTSTSLSNLAGQSVMCHFAGEACRILDFNYNASVAITPSSVKDDFYPDGCHGVLGYGVDAPPDLPSDSTLLGVYLPPGIKAAECGFELNRVDDGVGGGLFTMGGRDTTAFSGDLTTMTVPAATSVKRPSWTILVDNVFAGISGSMENILPPGLASIDPYYPTISIPAHAVSLLYSRVAGAVASSSNPGRYTVPCDSNIEIRMTFGGKDFTLDPRDSISKAGDTCYGTVEVNDDLIYKFGSPLLRNVYTIFGAKFSGKNATFSVAFADKVKRVAGAVTSSSGTPSATSATPSATTATTTNAASRPTNAAAKNGHSIFFSLLVVASISAILA